ncbi:MAG: DUF6776 family protein [Burkholderiaceae bacterium]
MTSSNTYSNSFKFRLKFWLRRLSISAPQMAIRTQLPWPVRAVLFAIVIGWASAIGMWVYDLGRGFAGFNSDSTKLQIVSLKQQIEKLSAERDEFSTTVNASESRLNIEKSVQAQLAAQVKTLEVENAKLKEDLVFFESLLPATTGSQGISIRRLMAESIASNQLRYRLLVMQGGQGGKGEREYVGDLQLVVTVIQDGKSAMINFPDGKSGGAEKFKLGFKYYQRVEGVLTLPQGVLIKAVQARILDKGQIRAQQSVNL